MAVSTQGIIHSQYKLNEIVSVLSKKFKVDITVDKTHDENYKIADFIYNDERRRLSIFENYNDMNHVGFAGIGKVTLIDLNLWGSSIELIEGIVKEFGGYVTDSDDLDAWRYIEKEWDFYIKSWFYFKGGDLN